MVLIISFTDINECSDDPCDSNADCMNTEGSFLCQCQNGFNGDGFACTGKHLFYIQIHCSLYNYKRQVRENIKLQAWFKIEDD